MCSFGRSSPRFQGNGGKPSIGSKTGRVSTSSGTIGLMQYQREIGSTCQRTAIGSWIHEWPCATSRLAPESHWTSGMAGAEAPISLQLKWVACCWGLPSQQILKSWGKKREKWPDGWSTGGWSCCLMLFSFNYTTIMMIVGTTGWPLACLSFSMLKWRSNVNWLVFWNIWIIFPYIANNHPNWRTHIFQKVQTANQLRSTMIDEQIEANIVAEHHLARTN